MSAVGRCLLKAGVSGVAYQRRVARILHGCSLTVEESMEVIRGLKVTAPEWRDLKVKTGGD